MDWIDLGGLQFKAISGGRFRLDGGGMFGIIPRVLWQRRHAPDEMNRIELDTVCLVIRSAGATVVVESGNGDKMDAKETGIFALEAGVTLRTSLEREGVQPEDVSTVILTHLHMDHVGGCSERTPEGVRVVFSRAAYCVQAGEWDDAVANRSTMRVSYRPENLEPLEQSGRLNLVSGATEVLPGIRVEPAPGHTPHHQVVHLQGDRERAVFTGDVLPTWSHLSAPYNMAYDLEPYRNMMTKGRLVEEAAAGGWYVVPSHDPHVKVARIRMSDQGTFRAEPVEGTV